MPLPPALLRSPSVPGGGGGGAEEEGLCGAACRCFADTDPVVGKATDFMVRFQERFGYPGGYDAVSGYTAVYIYMRAVQKVRPVAPLSSGAAAL